FKKDGRYNGNDFKENVKSATAEEIKVNKVLESSEKKNDFGNSIFVKNREIGSLIPMGKIDEGRIIVGHNISFDRARIKEEYNHNKSDNRFIDTMALHVAVSGLCG